MLDSALTNESGTSRLVRTEVECLIRRESDIAAPRRGVRFLSRAGAFGSHHLPWALPRVLHERAKIKRLGGGSAGHESRAGDFVCSKDVNSGFIPGTRANAIAVQSAEKKRGSGRNGRGSSGTGKRRRGRKNATAKAGATENVSRAAKQQNQRQLASPRG